jgi:hypothetical protein
MEVEDRLHLAMERSSAYQCAGTEGYPGGGSLEGTIIEVNRDSGIAAYG